MASLCDLVGLPRSSFYRQSVFKVLEDQECETELRHQMQLICLEMPGYSYRRITAELHRRGWPVNHKRVLRLMRQDNLLCLRRKAFVRTTDSEHGFRVYPNLATNLMPSGLNQLWISDITYIRLQEEFVYLAIILDRYSRRVIGWSLSRHIDMELSLSALRMALSNREVLPGLIHHSDRGVQYASKAYIELLEEHKIAISMSRRGNPYDNAFAESFMKTLKYEEVLLNEYGDYREAQGNIARFIEEVYNRKRLHSSIGYLPPVEFEARVEHEISPASHPT
ncbi:gll2675 [Gloeobacter violaceus PCC 7421]|uniref:Gll2675 protein n=1 Tax=Gloeobacter violaceus (strain ATCC 29082 / PCC 7421) TaxID=251221 RepID=Q7NH62_GLOVI|nr:gll2675 [Gloeobacter violaceus PCC 7421]